MTNEDPTSVRKRLPWSIITKDVTTHGIFLNPDSLNYLLLDPEEIMELLSFFMHKLERALFCLS
jgi:hypothetical protein